MARNTHSKPDKVRGPRRAILGGAKRVVTSIGTRVPGAADAAARAVDRAAGEIERSSDERLAAGATLGLGVAMGLLMAGAQRLLVVAFLLPVMTMAVALLDRQARLSFTSRRPVA